MCALASYGKRRPRVGGESQVQDGSRKAESCRALLAAALDALPDSVAVVDVTGRIIAVNDAWRRHAEENGMRWSQQGAGYNYLAALDHAAETGDDDAARIAAGLRRVLAGAATSFRAEYACPTLAGCCFLQQATAFEFGGLRHVIVTHKNVTARTLNEDEFRAAMEAADNARLEAVENERSRLARELHDAVTQTLFSASIVAEALPRVWARDPGEGQRALEDLRLWTRGALAELRSLLMELRPTALIEKPLPDLFRQLAEAAETRLGVPVCCDLTAEAEPPVEVKLCLYRVAQEALHNIAKHSYASHVDIRYLARPHAVELAIADNGRGFDVDGPSSGQMGLRIMRERTQQVGARLTIRSAPGEGAEVRVEWRPRGRRDCNG